MIIYPPTIDWNWMKQRPQHLMEQFAINGHDVYFCNRTQIPNQGLSQLSPHLYIVHHNREFIKRVIPKLKKEQEILVWITWPKHYPYIEQYLPDFIVYDFVDDFPSWSKDVVPMIQKADQIFVTSSSIEDYLKRNFSEKRYQLIPNGCEIEHFQQFNERIPEKPKEISQHHGTIIGYSGAWAPWIDENLIKETAKAFPDSLIVLIGAEFGKRYKEMEHNIKFLGMKSYDSLPQYLYYFDVCLIPFKVNQITKAANPIKLYEYLAVGKPVVSTDLPEVRNIPNVYIAKDVSSFIQHINFILAKKDRFDPLGMRDWLYLHSWEKRYQDIKQILEKNKIL